MRKPSHLPWFRLAAIFMIALSQVLSSACSNSTDEAGNEESDPTQGAALGPADPASFPDIVASVNGTEIRKADLLEHVANIKAQVPPSEETGSVAFFRRALDEIVGAELLYQASKERNLTVDAAAVEQQLAEMRGQMPDPADFDEALAQQGLTLDKFKVQLERNMSIQKLVEADFAPNVTVSEEAKKAYYNEHPEQMGQAGRLRLSHILKRVAPNASPEIKEAARKSLEDILEQARGGADFAALAREHSEDPGSASTGGELVVGRGETVPPFEAAALALEPGDLSPVVETQFGFHIIKLTEKIAGQLVPYEQVETRIEQFLMQQAIQQKLGSAVESFKASGKVELFI